ncbi:MAG TPA: ArsC family (seleno)protein [Bryobacteraceae bacterium]|nr:ArsC family (seleno)protein [Bryobacteraceae bacterium]
MKSISWSYHRKGCNTCARTQDFLVKNSVDVAVQVDARKNAIGRQEALALARRASAVLSTRGKSVKRLSPADATDEAIAELIIGPSGNLRAPAFFVDDVLMIGFEESAYRTLLT